MKDWFPMAGFYSNNPILIGGETQAQALANADRVNKEKGVRAFGMFEKDGKWILFYWDNPLNDKQWKSRLNELQTSKKL